MIIDCHSHIYSEAVAAKLVPRMVEFYGAKTFGPATLPGLLDSMQSAGIEKSIVLPSANRPSHVESYNDWCAVSQKAHESLIFFGALHPSLSDPISEAERIVELGLHGVKFQPNAQGFYPDDERIFPVYEKLVELGLPVSFHCGDELFDTDPIYASPTRIRAVLESFPDLIVQLAHLGGFRCWENAELLSGFKNTWFDLAFCPQMLEEDRLRSLVEFFGKDKIIFGTDYPWVSKRESWKKLEEIYGKPANLFFEQNPKKYIALLR